MKAASLKAARNQYCTKQSTSEKCHSIVQNPGISKRTSRLDLQYMIMVMYLDVRLAVQSPVYRLFSNKIICTVTLLLFLNISNVNFFLF